MGILEKITAENAELTEALHGLLADGQIRFKHLKALAKKVLSDQDRAKYIPIFPDALGEDKYCALVSIIDGCFEKLHAKESYFQSWKSLCRETGNGGDATSPLKMIHDLFVLTQPWGNYTNATEKELYIRNFKMLFEDIAQEFCYKQMTLDGLYESLKLKMMTHQERTSAPVFRSDIVIPCMTIHKFKGLEFDTVVLFAGNTYDLSLCWRSVQMAGHRVV